MLWVIAFTFLLATFAAAVKPPLFSMAYETPTGSEALQFEFDEVHVVEELTDLSGKTVITVVFNPFAGGWANELTSRHLGKSAEISICGVAVGEMLLTIPLETSVITFPDLGTRTDAIGNVLQSGDCKAFRAS